MIISQLNYREYKGRRYSAEIHSDRYLSIEPGDNGFEMHWVDAGTDLRMSIQDSMLSDWLEYPIAYGAFEDGRIVGFVEGFLEKWNNRFRITNICVFDESDRKCGVGTLLLNRIMVDAVSCGARMAVLETRSFNFKAVSFYQKNGFEIIGFDRYAYSNYGPEEHNMRIEMGRKIS